MASSDDLATPDSVAESNPTAGPTQRPHTPTADHNAGPNPTAASGPDPGPNPPLTPSRAVKRAATATPPRVKKKIPWKGKSVIVLLPKDEERGQPGKPPIPLTEANVIGMLRSWQELGYDIGGFDLYEPDEDADPRDSSQSKRAWPDPADILQELQERDFKVVLPDLNAWKRYVDELNEAKLRALGVSFADEEPPPPSISPASALSRQPSIAQYPPLPFSPPIPTSSASSNQALAGFPFPAQLVTSAAQSPGVPAGVSPGPFGAKFNPRASISGSSPHAWSPQLLLQQGHRGGSPSLANLGAVMSPASPFSPDGIPGSVGHQRHQSLQFSTLPHQFQPPVRASPRLQELREVDEEAVADAPPATSEQQRFVRHNASDSLQREIDEAEYHLEEQMRSQLDNDQDYSPHNDKDKPEAGPSSSALGHAGDQLMQFAPQSHRFASDADGLVLHHPRPHSRGHSLSQKYFTEDDVSKQGAFRPTLQQINAQPAEEDEIETNPSNLGTPVQALEFSKLVHQRGFSTASNPWTEEPSNPPKSSHQPHQSRGSVSSFSKLNVEAPEFKFNPTGTFSPTSAFNPTTSTFNPGAFSFTSNSFQPMAFNAGMNSATLSQPRLPTTGSSKINVNAPVFSPGQSEFSFSTTGPKFRPDAPAFTPHSLSTSLTSPITSGPESGSNLGGSVFGTIDLKGADHAKPGKRSKAIPIVAPDRRKSPAASGTQYDADDRPVVDESRIKRARANAENGDDVPLFAERAKEDTPAPVSQPDTSGQEDGVPVEEKSFDESNLGMSSTMVSETTDTKATVSPSEPSPEQATVKWAPFEFNNKSDAQAFNDARPFDPEALKPAHKKSLSATAKEFVPGAAVWEAAVEQAEEPVVDQKSVQPVAGDADTAAEDDAVAISAKAPERSEQEEAAQPPEEQAEEGEVADATTAPAEPGPQTLSSEKGLSASRYAQASPPPPPQPKRTGLAASRFAAPPPSPPSEDAPVAADHTVSPLSAEEQPAMPNGEQAAGEPSMADIDEVMRLMNENPDMGVNRTYDDHSPWHEHSPLPQSPIARAVESSPSRLPPSYSRSDAPSPSQADGLQSAAVELEDPFVEPPRSGQSVEGAIHRLNGSESLPASDWEGVFGEEEQNELESRVGFFDGRVNQLVGGLLDARLGPLERTLDSINRALSRRTRSSRREGGSISVDNRDSDADDEDDEVPGPPRSLSPRRDRKMEQIRAAVLDAFAVQRRNQSAELRPSTSQASDNSFVLKALEEMREQMKEELGRSVQPAIRSEEIRSILEDVVERRIPPPQPAADKDEQLNELQARVAELEQQLVAERTKAEAEVSARRAAEDRAAEANRELHSAATRIEVEMMNKSALNRRIADLEERLQHAEGQAEEEVKGRRAAEDRLSEVQRLLRISSEEETRLRELVDEKDQRIKLIEAVNSKNAMRLTVLEASQANVHQAQSEAQNRINSLEADAREARKEAQHWRSETDRIVAIIQRRDKDLAQALDENKAMHKLIDTLGTQLQENERVRDTWRAKFIAMQDEMAQATKAITEENARRIKKEQALLAKQEVLEARLQAEARTRERIETELERLEMGERQGMRAVAECKRLEGLLAELRAENHKLHQSALRYQAEFREARESGAREVQRTREAMQAEVENANHQVNVAREELEAQVSRLRAELDQVRLDADTAKARHDMLLEEAQNSKQAEIEELVRKHQNEVEDLQARYERQLSNTTEDAQRAEQNLLERLSISTSKSEYLQDKVAHLEEKLEIAKEAARAAAQAAKSASGSGTAAAQAEPAASSRQLELPEKISPQALRESIMVLQEQLQEREQRIEELETKLSKTDPEAEVKISKRDDEIIWLRELLAVRHSDLQDIITALSRDDYDKNAVKDAAIRLKANLQMEEQERERAMNGGSAINLPNIAATIQAATPRVAQAVGPLAAAWGNWRKARELGSVLSSPAPANGKASTPSRASSASGGLFGGLMTPPASRMRTTPPNQAKQPTAFSSTGRRFTAQDLANRPKPPRSSASPSLADDAKGKAPAAAAQETPQRRPLAEPVTPPMMSSKTYDDDAQAEDFDDAGFFED
ncbi:hypothetical protein MYCTH_2297957 [Thermothelomyces thermophilus ATCC 42464]|uniref:Myosin class II heavy chain n=1 Tax=Thermothelomyces thermophilus (strain ATCC 42464 / BCRC 31852 / DSM 1799) TaxID=573729 RepID=G2Q030_THET4|nr:uncharacterized protein MYCTH_2297957 [Thermothelomyces thermophilus ATCC 42464]AEO54854.1 hypothetical protein MYCTH_2297957 [Thermothelomyces thermophilus ATCC 42464]